MTRVVYVDAEEMREMTGSDKPLGYSFPQHETVLIRKGLPASVERIVREHEFEHLEKGEEGPFFPGIGAIISGAAPLIGSIIGRNASRDAADQAARSADAATAENRRQFDIATGLQQPAIDARDDALAQLLQLLTPGTSADALQQLPGFQFNLDQNLRAVEGSAAGRGGTVSGATLKALQDRGAGVASNQFNAQVGNLLQLAGLGSSAAGQVANSSIQTGQLVGNNILTGGLNQSLGTLGAAQNTANAINAGGDLLAALFAPSNSVPKDRFPPPTNASPGG